MSQREIARSHKLYIIKPSKKNDKAESNFNRKRSFSEPWDNSWDFKLLGNSSDVDEEFKKNKERKEDSNIFNNTKKDENMTLGLTDVNKNMMSLQLTKEEMIRDLKSKKNHSNKRVLKKHTSFKNLPNQETKDAISVKRLSMKNHTYRRRSSSKRKYDKSRMSLKTFKVIESIIHFCIENCDDPVLVDAVIIIERSVAPIEIIIENACRYYNNAEQDEIDSNRVTLIKRGIINFLGKNISILPYLITSSDGILNIINNFIKYHQNKGDPTDIQYANVISKILGKAYSVCYPEDNVITTNIIIEIGKSSHIYSYMAQQNSNNQLLPKPILGKKLIEHIINQYKMKQMINILYISPIELARQWTLLDHSLIVKLTPDELIDNAKNPKKSEILNEVADHFNHSTIWVAQQILKHENVKKRAIVISYLIELANQLMELQNFQGLLAVITGLTQVSISRLRMTWKRVSSKHMKIFKNLQNLTSPYNNFSELRKLLVKCNPPFIPSLSIIMRDMMSFVDVNGSNFIEKNIIKTDNILLCHKILSKLVISQVNPYKFYSIPIIQESLKSGIIWDEGELEKQSNYLEPGTEF